jgi:hypothetical protein
MQNWSDERRARRREGRAKRSTASGCRASKEKTFVRSRHPVRAFVFERDSFGKTVAVFQIMPLAQQAGRRAALVSPKKRREELAAQSSPIHCGGHC